MQQTYIYRRYILNLITVLRRKKLRSTLFGQCTHIYCGLYINWSLYNKVPVNAEITFLLFKERRPFKLKKEYPSEQWQIISFRLIPLETSVSFRWTVPLKMVYLAKNPIQAFPMEFSKN
jgi:hypothetical protein